MADDPAAEFGMVHGLLPTHITEMRDSTTLSRCFYAFPTERRYSATSASASA